MFFTSDSGKIGGAGFSGLSSSGPRPVNIDIFSSKPWDGDEPPTSIYADDTALVRRENGIWCKRDIEASYILSIELGKDVLDQKSLKSQAARIVTNGGLVRSVHTCGGNYVKG